MDADPDYQQLARDLRAQILRGEFDDGRPLPTEAELATQYAVSRHTVRRAFQDLVAEGLVSRTRGRGTFVRRAGDRFVRPMGSVEELLSLSEDTRIEVVQPLTRKVDLAGASRLRLATDVVYEIKFVRLHEEQRFCMTTVLLPSAAATLVADISQLQSVGALSSITIIGLLDARLAFPIAEAHQSITVGSLEPAEAQALGCDPLQPTLRVDRLYLDSNGDGVELAISQFLPGYYSYRSRLRREA